MTGRAGRAGEENKLLAGTYFILFFLLALHILLVSCRLKQTFDFSGAGPCS